MIESIIYRERLDRLLDAVRRLEVTRSGQVKCHDEFDGPDAAAACIAYDDEVLASVDSVIDRFRTLCMVDDSLTALRPTVPPDSGGEAAERNAVYDNLADALGDAGKGGAILDAIDSRIAAALSARAEGGK